MKVEYVPVVDYASAVSLFRAGDLDLVWFGVIAVMLTEAALISPPEGLNLYVIHGFRKQPPDPAARRTIMDVYLGVIPFFLLMSLGIVLVPNEAYLGDAIEAAPRLAARVD